MNLAAPQATATLAFTAGASDLSSNASSKSFSTNAANTRMRSVSWRPKALITILVVSSLSCAQRNAALAKVKVRTSSGVGTDIARRNVATTSKNNADLTSLLKRHHTDLEPKWPQIQSDVPPANPPTQP